MCMERGRHRTPYSPGGRGGLFFEAAAAEAARSAARARKMEGTPFVVSGRGPVLPLPTVRPM